LRRLLCVAIVVYLLTMFGVACSSSETPVNLGSSSETPVNLGDSIAFVNGNVVVTNATDSDWNDVKLVLNQSYTYVLSDIKIQQRVVIPANEFLNNGKPFDASTTKAWSLNISCQLANGKRGEFVGGWH
jgi:hypothetical protein